MFGFGRKKDNNGRITTIVGDFSHANIYFEGRYRGEMINYPLDFGIDKKKA